MCPVSSSVAVAFSSLHAEKNSYIIFSNLLFLFMIFRLAFCLLMPSVYMHMCALKKDRYIDIHICNIYIRFTQQTSLQWEKSERPPDLHAQLAKHCWRSYGSTTALTVLCAYYILSRATARAFFLNFPHEPGCFISFLSFHLLFLFLFFSSSGIFPLSFSPSFSFHADGQTRDSAI